MVIALRLGALALGIICAGLGCFGAYEYGLKLEGGVGYLVLAAPVIAGASALIPVLAEAAWRHGARLKSLLWWLVLVPALAVVFFSAAERVHVAKAGAQAERDAARAASGRSEAALTSAQAEVAKAQAAANKARAQKQCGPSCRGAMEAEKTAQANLSAAKGELLKDQRLATTDATLVAPVWLLPAALDAVAFMAIWTGLSGFVRGSGATKKAPPKRKTSTKAGKRKPSAQPKVKKLSPRERAEALFKRDGTTGNVVNFPAH